MPSEGQKRHRRTCNARSRPFSGDIRNGAKWRAIPEDLGPWWRAAQIFIRWSRAGVWERLLGLVHERGVQLGMVFLDGTTIRAHQKAADVAKRGGAGAERDTREALGRSRGGYDTKACVIADGRGRAIAFGLAPGARARAAPCGSAARPTPGMPKWVVGDRGYTSHASAITTGTLRAPIPPQRHETPSPARTGSTTTAIRSSAFWARLKE